MRHPLQSAAMPLPEFATGTAVVIGGSGGIGTAICRELARLGSNVVLSYRSNQSSADAVVAAVKSLGRDASAAAVEMGDAPAVKRFVDDAAERFGSLHSVVYAAGPALHMRYIGEIQPDEWAATCNADINGCFNMVWAALPQLRKQQSGSLLAVITAAVDRAPPRDIMSAAPKAAIEMLIRGVAKEEGRHGIRANCVGPGWIDGGLGAKVMATELTPQYIAAMTKAIPLRTIGASEDVAAAVGFMLSNQARYITGETLCVAGGLQL